MNDLEYFELHKNNKKQYLAKGKNYITFDESWSVEETQLPINYAIDDFNQCLKKSFNTSLAKNTSKTIKFSISEINDSFIIKVEENCVEFSARDNFLLVQAIYYAEDLMEQYGDASLEIKKHIVNIKNNNRIATSALENGVYTKEYINILLHYGYNGAILYYHDEESLKNLKEFG